jgi:hypothetical protein
MLGLSCSILAPSGSGSMAMEIEELSNGYLVHIVTSHPVGEVSTAISSGNWLLITIADSTIVAPSLESVRSPLVDSVEVAIFQSALQISLHLTRAVSTIDIIHRVPSTDVMISLFTKKEETKNPG